MHGFVFTETLWKCYRNASSEAVYMPIGAWVNHTHAPRHTHTHRDPNQVLHGYLLNFVAVKFSWIKVCDAYRPAERGFNFLNLEFF